MALAASRSAFAALLSDQTVVTWGDLRFGGNSQEVVEQLVEVGPVPRGEKWMCVEFLEPSWIIRMGLKSWTFRMIFKSVIGQRGIVSVKID